MRFKVEVEWVESRELVMLIDGSVTGGLTT